MNVSVHNKAISGSTIGNYCLYPVKESLWNLIFEKSDLIKIVDKIVLSYGINDISSVAIGYTNLLNVKIDLNKCLDYIKQINPNCDIQFITVSLNSSVLRKVGECQLEYLKKYLGIDFNYEKFVENYVQSFRDFNRFIYKRISEIFTMFEYSFEYKNNLDNDEIHPNDIGYEIICNNLIKQGFLNS